MAGKDVLRAATKELAFPGELTDGARGQGVRRLQEWLAFHRCATPIDGEFGPATRAQLDRFVQAGGAAPRGALDEGTWTRLVAPLATAIAPIDPGAGATVASTTLRLAQQHLAAHPVEIGGDNRGPWVRAYMDGNEGPEWAWCAGFVTLLVAHACQLLDVAMPVTRTFSCDVLAMDAKAKKRLSNPKTADWPSLGAAQIFLVQRTSNDWTHTGLAFAGNGQTFSTIEGNTNDSGSREGFEVCARERSLDGKSIVVLD